MIRVESYKLRDDLTMEWFVYSVLAHFLQIDIVKLLKNLVDLVVARAEPPPHILVVQDLDLEGEVLLHVLDDHDKVGQLDAERLLGIRGTR